MQPRRRKLEMALWGSFLLVIVAVRMAVEGHPEVKRRVMPLIAGLASIGIGSWAILVVSRQMGSTDNRRRSTPIITAAAALFALAMIVIGMMVILGVLPKRE